MTRLGLSAAASLAAHALAWLALLLLPGLVGRHLSEPVREPAVVELLIGEGGQNIPPDRDQRTGTPAPPVPQALPPEPVPADPTPAEPAPPAPVPAEPAPRATPPEPDETAPPLPPPPPAPAPAQPPPPAPGPPAIRLGTVERPPHADLLDPNNTRFRKATQDSGNRMPAYPLDAALRLESGTVKLQLFVDPTGRVSNVLVLRSSGSVSLDSAARDQALTWRFTPARRDGKPVPDLVEIEIEFKLL